MVAVQDVLLQVTNYKKRHEYLSLLPRIANPKLPGWKRVDGQSVPMPFLHRTHGSFDAAEWVMLQNEALPFSAPFQTAVNLFPLILFVPQVVTLRICASLSGQVAPAYLDKP